MATPLPRLEALFLLLATFLLFAVPLRAQPPPAGPMPEVELRVPEAAVEREYLGLPAGGGTFRLSDVAAEIVIIEVFNFYCPHCQRAAPKVNELYQLLQQRRDPKLRVKIIGIGAGNGPVEVSSFREKFVIPFPLFQDRDLAVTKLLEARYTPTFIGVRVKGGHGERFFTKESGFADAQQFLGELMRSSGADAKEQRP